MNVVKHKASKAIKPLTKWTAKQVWRLWHCKNEGTWKAWLVEKENYIWLSWSEFRSRPSFLSDFVSIKCSKAAPFSYLFFELVFILVMHYKVIRISKWKKVKATRIGQKTRLSANVFKNKHKNPCTRNYKIFKFNIDNQ